MLLLLFTLVRGVPPTTAAPGLNINPGRQEDSQGFVEVSRRLSNSVEFNASPCDDFHSYTCSNFDGHDVVFNGTNVVLTAAGFLLSDTNEVSSLSLISCLKTFLKECYFCYKYFFSAPLKISFNCPKTMSRLH